MLKKSIFYIIPVLIFLFLDELFIPLPYGDNFTSGYEKLLLMAEKLAPFGAMIYILVNLNKLKLEQAIICLLPILYFAYLVFESLYYYNSLFQFPHVSLKIMQIMIAGATFIFFIKRDLNQMELLMNIIILALIIKIAIYPQALSSSAFVGHQRGIPAPSALMLLLPCLFFFNKYLVELSQVALIKFLILFALIIFFQHRTVWVAASFAFLFNFFILKRQNQLELKKAIPGFVPIAIILFMISSVIFTYFPDMVVKVNENVAQILNPTTENSTSDWRLQQMESYMPFVMEHPVEGLRLKGFELPIQFFRSDNDIWFRDETGHHFHNFYFDKLFYFGAIGIFIFMLYILKPIFYAFRYGFNISYKQISFLSFAFGGLIYGLGYDLPIYYWAIIGVCLALVEKEKIRLTEPES